MLYVDSLDPAVVLPAMDANMATFWSEYGRASGCALEQVDGGLWFHSGVPHPFFNGVPRAVFHADSLDHVVGSLRTRIETTGAPAFWWVGPNSAPESIGTQLGERGIPRVGSVPVMAMDLRQRVGAVDVDVPGLTIERVENAEQQTTWGRVAATGSGFSPAAVEALTALEGRLGGPAYRKQYRYIGVLDGVAVATSAMVNDSGVAGIYAVATLPEARLRGIGKAMSVAPLLDARAAGCLVAVLQASPAGYPIYRKIGFSEIASYGLHLQSAGQPGDSAR